MKFRIIWLAGILLCLSLLEADRTTAEMIEICDNGIDDDGDGLIDLNDDQDCDCRQLQPNSLIPNPSFEDHTCCPSGRSQLNCAADWIQASEPTTDYINLCGWLGWNDIPAPMPFPDGDAIIGFRDGRVIQGNPEPGWKEYAGACLNEPLKPGVQYTFEFYVGFVNPSISPALNMTFFASADCDLLPFGTGDSYFGCPTNGPGWNRLGAKRVGGVGWVKTSITVIPDRELNAIAIGPECANTVSTISLYYFLDNLVLAETRLFPKDIVENGNPCADDFELSIEPLQGARYQWYRDGIAIVGETGISYRPLLTDGDYAVMELFEGLCTISKVNQYRVYEGVETLTEVICAEDVFRLGNRKLDTEGMYEYRLKTKNGCDSIIMLDLTVRGTGQDSVVAKIFPGEEFNIGNFLYSDEGSYDLVLQSTEGCDSLVHLNLSFYQVFIPNTFSPNDDDVNDRFEVFIEDPDVTITSMIIFDRWGNRIYQVNAKTFSLGETNVSWDGLIYENEKSPSAVYVYVIEFRMGKDVIKQVIGDVTIVK